MKNAAGFTLLEVLVALAVFAMIAAFTYASAVPAGEGFKELQKTRKQYVQAYALGRQMRLDVTALAVSQDTSLSSLGLENDMRSGLGYDQLTMLVREPDRPGLSLVRYYLDEDGDEPQLVREVVSSLTSSLEAEPLLWNMGVVDSFDVQAVDKDGRMHDVWNASKKKQLPSALIMRWKNAEGERELLFPIFVEIPTQTLPPGFG